MTTQRRMFVAVLCTLAVLASVVAVGAQATQDKNLAQQSAHQGDPAHQRDPAHHPVIVQNDFGAHGPEHFAFGQGDNNFVFVSSEMSFDGKTVKGAPYSAQAVTEMVQTLADGNRIVRHNTASVYRDSEGRTRREQTIEAVGAYSASGELPQMILINDPVAGVNYILDVKSHTARKVDLSAVRKLEFSGEGMAAKKRMSGATGATGAATSEEKQKAMAELKAQIAKTETHVRVDSDGKFSEGFIAGVAGGIPGSVVGRVTKIDPKNVKKEALGKQTIEGVEAEGVRFTTTIAAGEIGNEQPINIVSERWYSEELQTVVMSKHSDPRMGENTYRLVNINRSEPAHSLFEMPSDYTVKELVEPGTRLKIENEVRRPRSDKQEQ